MSILISASALAGFGWLYGITRDLGQQSQIALSGSRLTGSFANAQSHAKHFVYSGDPSELEQAKRDLATTKATLASLHQQVDTSESGLAARLSNLDEAAARLEERLIAISDISQTRTHDQIAVEMDRLTFAGDQFLSQAETTNQTIEENLATMSSYVLAGLGWIIGTIAILGLCAISVAVLAMRYARSKISAPIERITEVMRAIVHGKASLAIPETDRQDEIGEMASSLTVFRNNAIEMQRLQSKATEAAQTELNRLAGQDRLRAVLADKFELTVSEVVGSVAAASAQLQMTASSMAATAEHSADQTGKVSKALKEASFGVTAAAAASDEFAMSIHEISRQAANSAEMVRQVASSATAADTTIAALAQSTEEIGKIVDLIASIAQRTNLLALNASIEAARGGVAGRGFAVVAAEVKDLAAQTGRATDEVARNIRTIKESSDHGVSVLQTIGKQIGQLEEAVVSIATAVEQQAIAGQSLSHSVEIAARNTDDVSSRIGDVRDAASATGQAAAEMLVSSTELERQSTFLKAQADQFLYHVKAA